MRRGSVTERDREDYSESEDDEGTEVERKIYTYPTLDRRMVIAATKPGAGERAIAATVWVLTQPRAKWDTFTFDWNRFWTFLYRISMYIEGEETGPGFDGRQFQELRALWALPVFRTKEKVEEITTWTGWRRRDYTGTTLRELIYDTEEQPEWKDTPSTYGINMILLACERLRKVLAIVASKHFRYKTIHH